MARPEPSSIEGPTQRYRRGPGWPCRFPWTAASASESTPVQYWQSPSARPTAGCVERNDSSARNVQIAATTDGLDPLQTARQRPELLAQLHDVGIHAAVIGHEPPSKCLAGDRVLGDHPTGAADQTFQDPEFRCRQVDQFVVEEDRLGTRLESQVAGDKLVRAAPAIAHAGYATQDGSDSGDDFAQAAGFRNVVVCPGFQTQNAIEVIATRGQHDDRRIGHPSNRLQGRESVESGHHHVENDHVIAVFAGSGNAGFAIVTGIEDEATLSVEKLFEQTGQVDVVIDHQYLDWLSHVHPCCSW